jgi:signal transduction histidine kinase
MPLLEPFRSRQSSHVMQSPGLLFGIGDLILRAPIVFRMALGFLLAALLAAHATWAIGIHHAEEIRQQSNFYQAFLQTNMRLTTGSELLKSIDVLATKTLDDASATHPDDDTITMDRQALDSLMGRYNHMLLSYTSQDLLLQNPDQVTLLVSDASQTQVDQQRIYADGALRTWITYQNLQNLIMQKVALGEVSQAQVIARLRAEPGYADALSALHSLIQFNEQLSLLVDQGASDATQQQFTTALMGSLLAFLGVILIGVFMSHTFVQRLKQLHRVTKAVEQGQIEARVSVIGGDEIADVSHAVNTMLDSLVNAVQQTALAKKQLDIAYRQQCELNEMKDQFIANASHELRTPLTEMYGFLQLLHLQQGQLHPSQQNHFIEQAIHASEELITMCGTLLDASRADSLVQSPQLEILVLRQFVEAVVEQSDPQQRKGHPFHIDVPSTITVTADSQYLRQVLRNLISNAFKYTPLHTPIIVRATRNETGGDTARVTICVKDAGPGIPLEEQPQLFQRFVRLKRDTAGRIRGTGLGLYLCRQFVEAMHGQIWVESTGVAGEGSSFYFTLSESSTIAQQDGRPARLVPDIAAIEVAESNQG